MKDASLHKIKIPHREIMKNPKLERPVLPNKVFVARRRIRQDAFSTSIRKFAEKHKGASHIKIIKKENYCGRCSDSGGDIIEALYPYDQEQKEAATEADAAAKRKYDAEYLEWSAEVRKYLIEKMKNELLDMERAMENKRIAIRQESMK